MQIEINSAGQYCIATDRLLGVAPGSDGLGGIANFVRISTPYDQSGAFDDVKRIILMADLGAAHGAKCQAKNDGLMICAATIPGERLQAIVTFETPLQNNFRERTAMIAVDAAQSVLRE